eukprot:9496008-Pyramimonas_sp.AAC.1
MPQVGPELAVGAYQARARQSKAEKGGKCMAGPMEQRKSRVLAIGSGEHGRDVSHFLVAVLLGQPKRLQACRGRENHA